MIESAMSYLEAGLCVLPALRNEKRPAVSHWKPFQSRLPGLEQIQHWFSGSVDAVCVVAGSVSGNLEVIDFDCEAGQFEAWAAILPEELLSKLVIERTQSGGRHVIYRVTEPVCGNIKLSQSMVGGKLQTLIETRGEGGLFLCAPTPGYSLEQGSLENLPTITASEREQLLEAAWSLNQHQVPPVGEVASASVDGSLRPGDDFNQRGEVRELLIRHGWRLVKPGVNEYWSRPGKTQGWSATLKDRVLFVFSANAAPFEPNRAYAPFAVYAMLEHGGDFQEAALALRSLGFGDSLHQHLVTTGFESAEPPPIQEPAIVDPGPIPEHLFRVPGFVQEVMDFTLSAAPYPNVGLAFCGAIALQSFLAGRKVCTSGDLRTNLYLLALASSGTGKEYPRKVNNHILFRVGLAGSLGDKFASGEGIQDTLLRSGVMLFQNDEMDGVLRQINSDLDNRRESIPNVLLTLYTSASDIYPTRVKAGQKEVVHIDQPHLTLFGTATPQFFYESLSRRMLTNGFFARLSIVDVGNRGVGQKPKSVREIPESVIAKAKWWADFQPGHGNLQNFHPVPREVQFVREAAEALEQLRKLTEEEYRAAELASDEVARTAWSRTCEHATKLALIYACSENHLEPVISLAAMEWATTFAMHQTRRQLYLATTYVAENPFHAECLKLLRRLQTRSEPVSRSDLLRYMRCKSLDFDQIVGTLIQQGEIVCVPITSKTKTGQGYQLP